MNAMTLAELNRMGIEVAAVGNGNLHLSAAPGTLTEELLRHVAQSKAALLAELSQASRARLLALTGSEAVPDVLASDLSDDDAMACHGHTDDVLRPICTPWRAMQRWRRAFHRRRGVNRQSGSAKAAVLSCCGRPVHLW
jgi:hypothetical protein